MASICGWWNMIVYRWRKNDNAFFASHFRKSASAKSLISQDQSKGFPPFWTQKQNENTARCRYWPAIRSYEYSTPAGSCGRDLFEKKYKLKFKNYFKLLMPLIHVCCFASRHSWSARAKYQMRWTNHLLSSHWTMMVTMTTTTKMNKTMQAITTAVMGNNCRWKTGGPKSPNWSES